LLDRWLVTFTWKISLLVRWVVQRISYSVPFLSMLERLNAPSHALLPSLFRLYGWMEITHFIFLNTHDKFVALCGILISVVVVPLRIYYFRWYQLQHVTNRSEVHTSDGLLYPQLWPLSADMCLGKLDLVWIISRNFCSTLRMDDYEMRLDMCVHFFSCRLNTCIFRYFPF